MKSENSEKFVGKIIPLFRHDWIWISPPPIWVGEGGKILYGLGAGGIAHAIIIGNEVTGKYSMVFKCKCKLNLDYRLQSPPSAGGADFNE